MRRAYSMRDAVSNFRRADLAYVHSRTTITQELGLSLADHGFVQAQSGFENGLYGGQAAEPGKVAAALRAKGITRFVFTIDGKGQFDMEFSVWVDAKEFDRFQTLTDEQVNGSDPVEGLEKALSSASVGDAQLQAEQKEKGGVIYTQVNVADGTSRSRLVSPEEFVKGIKRDNG